MRRSLVEGTVGLDGGPISADAEAEIGRHRGGGTPLPDRLRQSMGQSLGADFSGVRVPTGPAADELSRSMQARAFTVGSDIFLARGQYRPHTPSGQRLLAHELTHTVQQGAVGRTVTPVAPSVQRLAVRSDNPGDWTNLASGKASGGVNGVVFAKAADNSEVVVKGMSEPPQRVMLAQDVFEGMGVATADTRPVAVSSKLGQHILQEPDNYVASIINGGMIYNLPPADTGRRRQRAERERTRRQPSPHGRAGQPEQRAGQRAHVDGPRGGART